MSSVMHLHRLSNKPLLYNGLLLVHPALDTDYIYIYIYVYI